MMRLLYIINGPGFYDLLSGGDRRAIEIGKRLAEWGEEIHILTTVPAYKQFQRETKKLKYLAVPPPPYFDKAESIPFGRVLSYIYSAIKTLLMKLSSSRYDILYSTSDFLCDTIPAWFYKRRSPKMKWVAMIHHMLVTPLRRRGSVLLNILAYLSQQISFRLIKSCADLIFVYRTPEGRRIRDRLLNLGVHPQNVVYVSNGIDYKLIKRISGRDKKFDACFVAALRPSKGSFDLVRIWEEVCNQREDAKLLIVGWGASEHMRLLRQEITKSGINENIVFAGWQPSKTVFELNKSSRIFISPSHEEGWGVAVCEAMACGLPVVAYDLPAYKIFKEGMITVPLKNVKAFARSILLLLENEELRMEIGNRAEALANNFDWNEVAMAERQILASSLNLS